MARGRRGRGRNLSLGTLLVALIAIAVVVALAGAAAFITIPGSLVVLALVLARPHGVGARVRQWALWRRVRGLEPARGRATFVVVLVLYGIVIPGACLGIDVAAIRGGGSGQPAAPSIAATSSTPSVALTQSSATPSPTPSDTSTIAATPAPPPPPPADPCHVGGVTYCMLNPDVSQATIGSTICVKGWTATIRPPESYTYNLKRQQITQEGLPGGPSDYEEDHRMPLELGGAPRDVMNLSPESPPSPNPKDSNETSLKYDVCGGRMTLAQAQQQMVSTWLAAYPAYRR